MIRADVTQEKDVERAVKETVDKFGRIDYAAYVLLHRSPLTLKPMFGRSPL